MDRKNLRDPNWKPDSGESLEELRARLARGLNVIKPRSLRHGAVDEIPADVGWLDDLKPHDLVQKPKLDVSKFDKPTKPSLKYKIFPKLKDDSQDAIVCFGKYRDKTLSEIRAVDPGYLRWITDQDYAPPDLRVRALCVRAKWKRDKSEDAVVRMLVQELRTRLKEKGVPSSPPTHELDRRAWDALIKSEPKLFVSSSEAKRRTVERAERFEKASEDEKMAMIFGKDD